MSLKTRVYFESIIRGVILASNYDSNAPARWSIYSSSRPVISNMDGFGKHDLVILRNFLATGGYQDILPSDENCVPLIPLYQQQRIQQPPGYTRFPLKLEVLFPVLCPRHNLCGRNHLALIDCRQTKLVLDAFDYLCQPLESREPGWQPGKLAKISQTTITGYFQSTKRTACKRKRSEIESDDDSDEGQKDWLSDELDDSIETDFAESDYEGDQDMYLHGARGR
ncbi:hypothetical protein MGU_04778 [Metarhizium guizhouense ARSEF 977]|uniref:Uncharacterized protein n=1 Tax=Metarhizium guizhouense (strain ARSEF 977) TaxID=1276136 RepID=A0A0B4GZY0_METGA|nr:hypothetical protein MGU_04778 [Metarhizium guizhouense ARSEF 977]